MWLHAEAVAVIVVEAIQAVVNWVGGSLKLQSGAVEQPTVMAKRECGPTKLGPETVSESCLFHLLKPSIHRGCSAEVLVLNHRGLSLQDRASVPVIMGKLHQERDSDTKGSVRAVGSCVHP